MFAKRSISVKWDCIERQAEVDRGHHWVNYRIELKGLDIPAFRMDRGVQQGEGANPALFTTLVEELLWKRWDAMAAIKEWRICIGDRRMTRISWADDSLLVASSREQLAHIRAIDTDLPRSGMEVEWADTENVHG